MALSASKKIALERDYRCPAVYTSDLQRDTHVPAIAARHYIDLGVNWQISGCVRMTCGQLPELMALYWTWSNLSIV